MINLFDQSSWGSRGPGIRRSPRRRVTPVLSSRDSRGQRRLAVKKDAADKARKDQKPPTEIGGSSPNSSDMSDVSFEEIQGATRGRSTADIRGFMNPDATPSRRAVMPGLPGLLTPGATVADPEAFQTAIKASIDASNQFSSHYKSDRKADEELDDKKTRNQIQVLESA